MSEIKLLPCPFCGGEAKVESMLKDRYRVICKRYRKCGATQLYANSKEEAIESWNTRKPVERILTKLKEARAECKELQRSTTDAYGYMKMKQGIDCGIDIVKEEGGIE